VQEKNSLKRDGSFQRRMIPGQSGNQGPQETGATQLLGRQKKDPTWTGDRVLLAKKLGRGTGDIKKKETEPGQRLGHQGKKERLNRDEKKNPKSIMKRGDGAKGCKRGGSTSREPNCGGEKIATGKERDRCTTPGPER